MSLENVLEKIGTLTAKIEAAHSRIDKLDKDVAEGLKDLAAEVKELNGFMNRSKGWGAATLFFSSLCGAGAYKLISLMFK